MVQVSCVVAGPVRMISRQFRNCCKTLAGANRPGMCLVALGLVLPLFLLLHREPGAAGEETGGIGGTGVAVEADRISGVDIQAADQYDRVAAVRQPIKMEWLMQPVTLNVMRHHRRTIWLHWLTLVLVAFQSVCAKGEPRMIAHSVDISVGFGFLAVIVSRVLWRISGGSRLPPADRRRALHLAVGSVHSGLYLLLAVTLALGALTARGGATASSASSVFR